MAQRHHSINYKSCNVISFVSLARDQSGNLHSKVCPLQLMRCMYCGFCTVISTHYLSLKLHCQSVCTYVCKGVDGFFSWETSKTGPTDNISICSSAVKSVKHQLWGEKRRRAREGGRMREEGGRMREEEERWEREGGSIYHSRVNINNANSYICTECSTMWLVSEV